MKNIGFKSKLERLHQRLNGSTIEYDISSYSSLLNEINMSGKILKEKSDTELQKISNNLKARVESGISLDDLIVEAFALVRETISRILNMFPFDVQVIGGAVMHKSKIAEMQTGEGKTLTAVFPAYLNSLTGEGVHILTFNDYLARRDAKWMGPVYEFLGSEVGYVQEGMSISERQKAYGADITYLTAKEAGFDFLRDSLCYNKEDTVHRKFNFALIDEVDSILIDEARIPLVIAGSADDCVQETFRMAGIVRELHPDIDFEYDEYERNIHLTPAGEKRTERLLGCDNIYDPENINSLTRLYCGIHAEYLLKRDVDYIVRNNMIELVDEFTGRVANKRRWPDGLHIALEAKENLSNNTKGNILNSITIQHVMHFYKKLCGMTGTAQSAQQEFRHFYNLDIVVIPPNKPCARIDYNDVIFYSKEEKKIALVKEIIKVHKTKQPILVGTRSVEESDELVEALKESGVQCNVLNAKNDEYEAEIISQAGRLGAVTISTNMAGRGTDIRLGGSDQKEYEHVKYLGGLYVIGTNKHESKRIDQQLRGRAGRQGDPGISRFFISLEDELFIKYRIKELIPAPILEEKKDGIINNIIVRNEVNRIQRIIEGQSLEIKKTLCKYSNQIENQRKIIFQNRANILWGRGEWQYGFANVSPQKYKKLLWLLGEDKLNELCKRLLLFHIYLCWQEYLAEIAEIRESIHLQRVAGKDPFIEFQKLSLALFDDYMQEWEQKAIQIFDDLNISEDIFEQITQKYKAPASTWTYLINDNPFENNLGIQLIGNIGLSIGAVMMTPILMLSMIIKKIKGNKR